MTNSLDALPKQFIKLLRTLFDILDEEHTGFVRFSDIEARWEDGVVKGLPSGVIIALRKVTPANGYLSFERFVAGLKLALFNQIRPDSQQSDKENKIAYQSRDGHQTDNIPNDRGRYQPGYKDQRAYTTNASRAYGPTTAAVRPNNAANLSYQIINPPKEITDTHRENKEISAPMRTERRSTSDIIPPQIPPRDRSKVGILNELKHWQRVRMTDPGQRLTSVSSDSKVADMLKSSANTDIYANVELFRKMSATDDGGNAQKPVGRRREPRRHTLASGVDYNMIKRMKQLEQEKDVLHQGLEVVESARDWYHKHLAVVQDKQRLLGRSSYNDYSVEAYQERMNFQRARILEANAQLKTLIDSSEKGFPLHMNLAMRSNVPTNTDSITISMLKEQNRQLTQEISQKSEKITQLEGEKTVLIRDLFQTQSKNKTNYDDTTFM